MTAPARPAADRFPASPLTEPAFRALWMSATVSYVGTFVQEIGERWLILDLTKSPLPAAMLATAFMTASLVAMLPAGVLADRFDRRRLVILSQLAQAAAAAGVGLMALFGMATPRVLVVGAAAAGLGMGLGAPAWSALVADIVRRDQVADAVTLNAIAFNIARAVGPAIGGVVLETWGSTTTFLANAGTFLVVVVAVAWSRRSPTHAPELAPKPGSIPPPLGRALAEPFLHAVRDAGIRSIVVAMVVFTLGASFVYVLLPPFAKLTLAATPRAYGFVIGAMGIGAVMSGLALRRLRRRFAAPALIGAMMLLYATSSAAVSQAGDVRVATVLCVPMGMGWTGAFSSLFALMQVWAPAELRARSLALYSTIHLAMWAIGASLSGALAESWGTRAAMLGGAVVCAVGGVLTARMPVPRTFTRTLPEA